MTPIQRAATCAALLLAGCSVLAQSPTQATQHRADKAAGQGTKTSTVTRTNAGSNTAASSGTGTAPRAGFEVAGLQLAMGRDSAKSRIPALQFHLETTMQGQEVGTLSCGLQIQGNPALRPMPCNFKWDNTDVRNLSLQYWGDRLVRINLLFNNYRFTNAQGEYTRMVERLAGLYGAPTEATQWQSTTERLWIDASLRNSSAMDILVLENTALAQNLAEATRAEEDAQAAQWRQQRSRRSLQNPANAPAETGTAPVATNAAGLP